MTVSTHLPAPLETYLRRATFGLPPQRRDEVWNELEEHILCRAEQLEFQGLAPPQALAQALHELGPPLRVSAAMNGVHNMPKLILFGTVATLAVSAGIYALAQQPAPVMQVPLETRAPRMQCVAPNAVQPQLPLLFKTSRFHCYQDDSGTSDGLYVSLSQVTRVMQGTGIKVTASASGDRVNYFTALGQEAGWSYPVFKRNGELYLDAGELMSVAMSEGFPFPVQARGFEQPTFTLGHISQLVLEGQGEAFSERVYRTLALNAVNEFLDFSKKSNLWGLSFDQRHNTERIIPTPFKAGEVIAAYHWTDSTSTTSPDGRTYPLNNVSIGIGVTDSEGKVKLNLPVDAKFVTTEPAAPGNEVLLAKLTNTPLEKLKSGLFLPKQ